jgi:DNA polymerase
MESTYDHASARARLDWHLDAGVDEAMGDAPIDRYALEAKPPKAKAAPLAAVAARPAMPDQVDPVAVAREMAAGAADVTGVVAAMQVFSHCGLQKGARNFVFAQGRVGARVMVIGEAPDRDEDLAGQPFVGPTGQLLDRMLAAIGLSRQADAAQNAVYVTNFLPWRGPANRPADAADVAMMLPFVERHITLAAPDLIVLMGNTPCQGLLGRTGISRLRGQWAEVLGRPALPMLHPSALLRQPAGKREAWADLLSLRARLADD